MKDKDIKIGYVKYNCDYKITKGGEVLSGELLCINSNSKKEMRTSKVLLAQQNVVIKF